MFSIISVQKYIKLYILQIKNDIFFSKVEK